MPSSRSNTDTELTAGDLADSLVAPLADQPPQGHYDCLRAPQGQGELAPHWSLFFASVIDSLQARNGIAETAYALTARLDELQQQLARNVEDNGVTYNLYADGGNQSRPWSVDLFPAIVPQSQWQTIAEGVAQRADLLNRILADVYGEQSLVRDGFLPSALVHGHPGYFRSVHGIQPGGGTFLHIAAFDLAQGPDGNWWVMTQRTQAPSGLGYALENRIIVSQLFQEAFSSLHIERLAENFSALVRSLMRHSPAGDNARIVVLTPGPLSETYFEHIYLARYLGIRLVEGGDLVVRDQKVWLKTINGLEQVDIILRRLDDEFLDPLELRSDSTLGIPGILQAWRAGSVIIANAPGCSFLETPAVTGFLPALSWHLLGEPLKLPSIASWWFGERAAMDQILPQLGDYVIKPTFNDQKRRFVPALAKNLSEDELEQWRERIKARPEEHSAQAWLPLSHTPTWCGGGPGRGEHSDSDSVPIGSQAVMMRVFALSDGPGSWRVMPGGLSRIAPQGREVVSMYRGGSSADLWVMADKEAGPLGRGAGMSRHPPDNAVTSRAAENMFWFGRYTERLDNSVRLARVMLESLNNTELELAGNTLDWLHRLAVENGLVNSSVPSPRVSRQLFERSLIASLGDRSADQGACSVAAVLDSLQATAFAVREWMPKDQWSMVDQSQQQFLDVLQGEGMRSRQALRALEQVAEQSIAITGGQLDRMTRDAGWRMLSLGRHLERLSTLADLLASAFEHEVLTDEAGFGLPLSMFDSTLTYRSRYQQHRDAYALIELLVIDDENPRSLLCLAHGIVALLQGLPDDTWTAWQADPDLNIMPHRWDGGELLLLADAGDYAGLAGYIARAVEAAQLLSNRLTGQYFVHAHTETLTVGG